MGISRRTLTDIKRGKYSLSSKIKELVYERYSLALPRQIETKKDRWHVLKAARLGAKRYRELYGPLIGTPESRRRGGLNSLKTPRKSVMLAEIIGVFMGDGNMSKRQAHIFLNLEKDRQYANYLKDKIEKLFGVKISLSSRPIDTRLVLTASSTKLISFLNKCGLPIGNKIKQGIDIPKWVSHSNTWLRACLRGLFDTDGCTYIDHHRYKDKVYGHICVAITSYSRNLLRSIYKSLVSLGYKPTISDNRNVLIRREAEVLRFFREIQPQNKVHYDKIRLFQEEYRSGHNGAASKADGDLSPS